MALSDERTRARLDFLEREARTRPRRHALRLVGLVLMGYLYPISLLLGAFALFVVLLALGPAAWRSSLEAFIVLYLVGLLLSLLLAAAIVRAFWVVLPEPPWPPLRSGEAPALREMIEDVRRAAGCGPIRHVHIDYRLNAAAAQRFSFGWWGPRENHLLIGVPLLMALTPEEFKAVLAHEVGHLRGRHNRFSAWIYRVHATWESLAAPFAQSGRWRRWVMGWFVEWYGAYFARSTLAMRRLHEYAADRSGGQICGSDRMGRTLLELDWAMYRLERRFWPAVIREGGNDPIPPADILTRMANFFQAAAPPDMLARWRARQQQSRTPISSEHPCDRDRLQALGCLDLLTAPEGEHACPRPRCDVASSALQLLGDARTRLCSVTNAYWKTFAIGRWRHEHAIARYIKDRWEERSRTPRPDQASPDLEWEQIEGRARHAHPDEAFGLLRQFLTRHPGHGSANFALGQLLLADDDETATDYLENALQNDSDFITPSLNLLLEYYRATGQDDRADPIRQRLIEQERAMVGAERERLHVTRRDRFLAHDVGPAELEKIQGILFQYPQVRRAYLVRKQVRLFTEKPCYVLAIERQLHGWEVDARSDKFLMQALTAQIPLPCAVIILKWSAPRLRSRLLAACPLPIFDVSQESR